MGEYATFRGQSVKLGTCEDMYYLRADQRRLIDGYDFSGEGLGLRYRFPFPDEDTIEPGEFDDHDRGVRIPGYVLPEEFGEHGTVQFVSQSGYLVSLPCPEGPPAVHGLTVHRNGWNGGPVVKQQKVVGDELWTVLGCAACGAAWRLEFTRAAEVAECFANEAEREEYSSSVGHFDYANSETQRAFLIEIGRRILDGYSVAVTS